MVMTQKDIITILAIIGALVVLGFVLRVTFALLGPLLLIGLGYIAYTMMKKGGGR
jgi:predicted membrane protein